MKELVSTCLNQANLLKADYADIRIVETVSESILVKNGQVEDVSFDTDIGFGVRILVKGCWGFAASFKLEIGEVASVTRLAFQIAQASALAKKESVILAPTQKIQNNYRTKVKINPFSIPIEEKLDLLLSSEKLMRAKKEVKVSQASMGSRVRKQTFASSEGSFITQEITQCGAGLSATAIRNRDVQTRSYPNSHGGQFVSQGYEFIKSLNLKENAEQTAEQAVALLSAKECPSSKKTVILDSSQLALQIHESIGHPAELDRVLGMEASFAGTSFLTLDKLGKLRYGSRQVNIVADATTPGALGSFGYDDEGVKAQKVDLIKKGQFVGYLTSRETAPRLGQKSNGAARADGWNKIPLVRMTNINLLPGKWSLEDMIADTKDGLYLETNKSWSIDDKRLNFQFATEIGWEIKNGRLGKMIKNPNYTGITPQFWNSCDAIGNTESWQVWGLPNCAKGEPMQIAYVGHGAAPARFQSVEVGIGR